MRHRLLMSVSVCAVAAFAMAQPSFQGVGDLPGGGVSSRALGVSGNGLVVVGESIGANGTEAFRWTTAGMVGLGRLSPSNMFSSAAAASFDGGVVAGSSGFAPSPFEARAFRWTSAGGMVALGPFDAGGNADLGFGASGGGAVIVGQAGSASGPTAFRWTSGGGAVGIGNLAGGGVLSSSQGVSTDGGVIAGWSNSKDGVQAFRWTSGGGMVGLGFLAGASFLDSRAHAISADGAVVAGEASSPNGPQEAFRWTAGGGMVGIGDLAGGAFRSVALGASGDGAVVVGRGETGAGNRAFIWDAANEMRDLRDVLVGLGLDLTGWTLSSANAASFDGVTIVGAGINPDGDPEGWVARLRTPCPADVDGDGVVSAPDLAMLLGSWGASPPGLGADLDGDGAVTSIDLALLLGAWGPCA